MTLAGNVCYALAVGGTLQADGPADKRRKAGDSMDDRQEAVPMTDAQAERADLLARLDELDRLAEQTTARDTLRCIADRKKALRAALDKVT